MKHRCKKQHKSNSSVRLYLFVSVSLKPLTRRCWISSSGSMRGTVISSFLLWWSPPSPSDTMLARSSTVSRSVHWSCYWLGRQGAEGPMSADFGDLIPCLCHRMFLCHFYNSFKIMFDYIWLLFYIKLYLTFSLGYCVFPLDSGGKM